jgi:hypothetical protein
VTLRAWLRVLRRRRLVVIAVLLLTSVVMAMVYERPIAYQACGSITLLPPPLGYQPNVYGNSLPPLVVTSEVVTDQVNSHQVQQRLAAQGLTASYDAEVLNTGTMANPTYTEPLVNVCSFAYDPVLPLKTTDAVMKTFSDRLRFLQVEAHVIRAGRITDQVIAPASSVAILGHSKVAVLGVGVAGLIAAIALAMWSDRILQDKTRSRKFRPSSEQRTQGSRRPKIGAMSRRPPT